MPSAAVVWICAVRVYEGLDGVVPFRQCFGVRTAFDGSGRYLQFMEEKPQGLASPHATPPAECANLPHNLRIE